MRHRLAAALALAVVAAGLAPAAAAGAGGTVHAQDAPNCSFPVTATDATGTEVTVEEKPERVVVLGASAAQTMWEIGGKEQVVGMPVKPWTSYLDGADERAAVTDQQGYANVEKVLGAEPDLVLAANINENETLQTLRDADVTVYKFGFAQSLSNISAKTNLTGRLTGNCAGAAEAVEGMQERIETVQTAVEGEQRPSVFYLMSGGFTAMPGTFVHDVVETAGGDNVAGQLNTSGYGQVSYESVIDADPDWIVVQYTGEEPDPSNLTAKVPDALSNTTAVQEGNIVAVNANYISQPAPRVVRPLTKLAETFHPGAYAQANATTTSTTTAATTETSTAANTAETTSGTAATESPATATTTSSGGTPGFTAPVALAALAGAALFARRFR